MRWLSLTLALAIAAAAAIAFTRSDRNAGRQPGRMSRPRTFVAGLYPVHRRSHTARVTGSPTPPQSAEIRRLLRLGLPIYCGGRRGNEVAFTFDDGPGPYTSLALKKLRQGHERATFFVVGRSITAYRGYLPRELKLAAIGDHTYTHPDLELLPPSQVAWQLRATAQLIHAQSGERVELFRPPYEAHNQTVDRIANRIGLLEVLWSVDSRDWLVSDYSQVIANVEAGLKPGAIVLMHENHGQTIRALTTLLPALRRRHLRSVTVPELLAADPPSAAQVRRGLPGCGEPARLLRVGRLAGG